MIREYVSNRRYANLALDRNIRELIRTGPLIQDPTSALIEACRLGDPSVLNAILESTQNDEVTRSVAAGELVNQNNIEMLRIVSHYGPYNYDYCLGMAAELCREEIVLYLISIGAQDIDWALILAASSGCYNLVVLLVEYGAKPGIARKAAKWMKQREIHNYLVQASKRNRSKLFD